MEKIEMNISNKKENLKESKGLENVIEILKNEAEKLNQLGIPVDEECRLKIEKFNNYPKEKIFYDKVREDRFKEKFNYEDRNKSLGEKFEKLKTALFQKYLAEEFIVCRTSFFDDVLNGVDNIILDKETGNIVCALDEVCDIHSKRYEDKRKKVLDVNKMGGAEIEYGFKFDVKDKKISLTKLSNVPLFLLGLNENYVNNCLKHFGSNDKFNRDILTFFIQSLKQQADLLINTCPKNSEISKNIANFQKVLDKIIGHYNLQTNRK